MKKMENDQDYLVKAPVGKLMAKYAIPNIISLVVSALYNIVDQLFIANADYLGSYGNAANTVVFPLTVICLSIAIMLGDGTNAFFTYCVGAKEVNKGRRSVGTSAVCVTLIGILFMAVYLIFGDQILVLFGANVNAETFANAQEYLFWIALGIPFYMLGQCLSPIICGDGSPNYAMKTMLVGCAINIVFDPILIYVTKWGMMGAAVATIAGQIVACLLNVRYLMHMKSIKLTKEDLSIDVQSLKNILPLGMTSFFAQISIVLSMVVVNNVLNKYGALDPIFSQAEYAQIPLAVVGIVFKFFQIIVSIAIGLSSGCIPIIGYNRGAGRFDRLRELLKKLLTAEFIVGLAAFIIFEVFARHISYLFGAANESIYYQDFAIKCIRLFLSMVFISTINKGFMIYMQGLGKAGPSTFVSVLREIVGGVGLPLILPVFFGFEGILYFMPVAEIMTFIFTLYYLKKVSAELKENEQLQLAGTNMTVSVTPAEEVSTETPVVITIGRSYGSGGRTIGKELESRLGIPCYDTRVMASMAKQTGMDEKYLKEMDEKGLQVSSLYMYSGGSDSSMNHLALKAQREVIEQYAKSSCIIIGRRADKILKGQKTLSVFITASVESRCERVMQRDHLDRDKAMAKIAKVDKERAAYYNELSDTRWGMAESYDLCIDTDSMGLSGAADIIETCYKKMNG